jgi:hypothetical protein
MANASTDFDSCKVASRIEQAAQLQNELNPDKARDVAFHMTDWIGDLKVFVEFCRDPDSFSLEQVDKLLNAFLIHAPNHLAAAAKLYIDIPVTDIFDVGAVEVQQLPDNNEREA